MYGEEAPISKLDWLQVRQNVDMHVYVCWPGLVVGAGYMYELPVSSLVTAILDHTTV